MMMGTEADRLSTKDGSPWLPLFDEKEMTFISVLLSSYLSILPLVGIVMSYFEQNLQHIISIGFRGEDWSPHSIGWMSSHLPPRQNGKEVLGGDCDGYRRIYGTFPDSFRKISTVAVLNQRLYLCSFGSYQKIVGPTRTRVTLRLVSCSLADLKRTALSTQIPVMTSIADAEALIQWKMDHQIGPLFASIPDDHHLGEPESQQTHSTTIWYKTRLVYVISDQNKLICGYYDTLMDKWHKLPDVIDVLPTSTGEFLFRMRSIDNILYLHPAFDVPLKYDEVQGNWMRLDTFSLQIPVDGYEFLSSCDPGSYPHQITLLHASSYSQKPTFFSQRFDPITNELTKREEWPVPKFRRAEDRFSLIRIIKDFDTKHNPWLI